MNKLKNISLTISLCAVFVAALYYSALITIPTLVDLNKYKDNLSKEIEKQSGLKFSCENIQFVRSLTPYFKIHLYHTVILYPDDEIFIKLKDADIKVKIFPLFLKKIVIKDAKLFRPIINVTLYKNLTTSVGKFISINRNVVSNDFKLDKIATDTICENYKLKIYDESINKTFLIEGDELTLKNFNPNEKVNLILKGTLSQNQNKYINYDINLKSFIGKNEYKISLSPFKQILDYGVKGNISGNLEIDKNNFYKGKLNFTDFSLNIDGNILKNNSASFLFNGQNAEFNSELHTSKDDEAKVSGKIDYGKKKKIDLNVAAKNINIAKLQRIVNVLSLSLNIPNPYLDTKLSGIFNADFSVNSDLKKLKSQGNAQIKDAQIIHKDIPYSVNKVNANINFNNNKIVIEQANAYINSTPVSIEGTVNEDVLLDIKASAENLDLRTVASLFFKQDKLPVILKNGKLSFVSDIKGKYNKDLKIYSDVKLLTLNLTDKKTQIPLSADNINIKFLSDLKSYSGDIVCSDLKTIFNKKTISSNNFKLSFDDKHIVIPDNIINIIASQMHINGNINNYNSNPSGKINFKGNLKSQNIADILSEYIKEPYKAVGAINTEASLNFLNDEYKISAKLNADRDNYLSYLVIKELLNKKSLLNVDAVINKKNINIKDISLKEDSNQIKNYYLKLFGQIQNDKEPEFNNFKIQIPDYISASMNFFGGEDISFNGDLTLNNSINNPNIIGNIKVKDYAIKKLNTSIKNADVSISSNNIRIIAPELDVNNSKFNAVLDVEPKLSDIITISNAQVNSLNLDLNTLFPMINNLRNPFADTVLYVKKGSATINNFRLMDIKARDISSDFTIKNNVLKAEGINASAYNGKISGDIAYDFNHASLDVNLIGKGIDIRNSLYDLCKLDDNLGGTTDFTSSITMKVGDLNTSLKSLSGKLSFDAVDGKMGTLGKFEYYMNAKNILYHGLMNATINRIIDAVKSENTAKFKTAKGTLLLQNGYIITDEIMTSGRNMSLLLKGKYNMLSNNINAEIYGRISDTIKSKLGSFADVSISDLINGQPSKKAVFVEIMPYELFKDITLFDNPNNINTNAFKVNINGSITSPSSINSFSWVVPDDEVKKDLPEFSEIPRSL